MIVSEIRYNQAIERLRFDAEFYKPEYLATEEVVKRFPKNLLISIIPEQTQISELVKKSFLLRKESKELIEQAKKEIEEFIEKGN